MKVKVTTAFNDMTVEDANARRREADVEFDASPERAEYLVRLGLVEQLPEPPAPEPAPQPIEPAAPAPTAEPAPADPLHLTPDMIAPTPAAPIA